MRKFLTALLALALSGSAYAQCNGNLALTAVDFPANVNRFVRVQHVDVNTTTGPQYLFDNITLSPANPAANNTPYFIFATMLSGRYNLSGPYCGNPLLVGTEGVATLEPNIQDYPNTVLGPPTGTGSVGQQSGCRGRSCRKGPLIPTEQDDGKAPTDVGHLWERGAVLQGNLNQAYTVIDLSKGPAQTNPGGWQCNGNVPAGLYQQWNMTVTGIGPNLPGGGVGPTTEAFIAPFDFAQHLSSVTFSTEFFTSNPGVFKVYLSNLQVYVDGDPNPHNLCRWELQSQCGDNTKYGVRVTKDEGGSDVIEISSDPTSAPFITALNMPFPIPGCS